MSGGSGSSVDWRPEPKPKKVVAKGQDGGLIGEAATSAGVVSDPCDINEVTPLASTQALVLATLKAGDTLSIVLEGSTLQAKCAAGIAGVITSPAMLQLIKCMEHYNEAYEAEVLTISKGLCRVRVRRS